MRCYFRASFATTLVAAIFLLSVCGISLRAFGQETAASKAPPKELVEYVREAKKTGQNEFQIQQNAVKSGWPEGVVNEAIAYVRSTDKDAWWRHRRNQRRTRKPPSSKSAVTANPGALKEQRSGGAPPVNACRLLSAGCFRCWRRPAKAQRRNQPEIMRLLARGVPDDYKIGAGDVLEVDVWKEPDASVRA